MNDEVANLYKSLVEFAPDSMIVIDQDGQIVLANAQAERLFGYGREELLSMNVDALVPERFRAGHSAHRTGYVHSPNLRPMGAGLSLSAQHKDGGEIPVEISLGPVDTAEGTLVTATIRDVSDQRALADELAEYASRLENSNQELEQFAYVASHDLQEPLRKIQAFGDRLNTKFGEQLGDVGQDYIARMQSASTRMSALINDLLSFSRVSTKAAPFQSVDLKEVVDAVLGDLEVRINETSAKVEVGELLVIDADRRQLGQLLQNLIGNALKFHAEGAEPQITIKAEKDRKSCVLTVADKGVGFDQAYADQIFIPFRRLHGRDQYAGSGIGLAICRKIVERHRGKIGVVSEIGKGTTFSITMPLHQQTEKTEEE